MMTMADRFALHVGPHGHAEGHADGAPRMDAGLVRAIAQAPGLALVGCFGAGGEHAGACVHLLREHGYAGALETVGQDSPGELARFGTLLHPGADLARPAWRRLGLGERSYSLCGVTHGIASHRAMSATAGLLTAPLRSWDALVCTARVVRDSVRDVLERQADYLRARVGARHFELPQLPLIPPGIHCADLRPDPARRDQVRQRLGIGADDVAFLSLGGARTHPQQLFSALERAGKDGRSVHLILCGCCAATAAEDAFREAAAALAPSVRLAVLDGRTDAGTGDAWAAADVFIALADDVPERVVPGPLDAMAAGLPCVVSDWGGYRDVVRDGVDGYRIPTVTPGPGAGVDLAQRYDDGVDGYAMYVGHASQAVALDGALLTQACERLIRDAGLRRELGANAQARAQREFDWSVVFARYRTLFAELEERRRADPMLAPTLPSVAPDRLDPFVLFASYPSTQITPLSLVELAPDASLALVRRYYDLAINRGTVASLPTLEEFGQIFGSIGSRPMQVDELVDALGPRDRPTLLRGLAWLGKMDLLRIRAAGQENADSL
jgi:alpha-maltose-1-phosphate synthase